MQTTLTDENTAIFSKIQPGTIIALSVVKGGAGKTASAVSIASGLALLGVRFNWRVLLVDIDPQSTAANAAGKYDPVSQKKNLAMLLDDDHKQLRPHEFITPSPWYPQNLHYIPSNPNSMEVMREAWRQNWAGNDASPASLKRWHLIITSSSSTLDLPTMC